MVFVKRSASRNFVSKPTKNMRFIAVSVLAIFLLSCGPTAKQDEMEFRSTLQDDSLASLRPGINDAFVERILAQIPSPLEVSSLLLASGAPFKPELLSDPENAEKFESNFRRALNLGVYGSDLYYTNIYSKTTQSIELLEPIKRLANDLDIGQFFDLKTMNRLASNSDNLDSLMLVTTQNFNTINEYLQDRKRSELSVLLFTGGWIEALNILCQVYLENPGNTELRDHIGEQKFIMERLILLYPYYVGDQHISELQVEMKKLETAFMPVKIVQTYKESTIEVVNGVGIIKDNNETTITITDKQAAEIARLTMAIRNKIIM